MSLRKFYDPLYDVVAFQKRYYGAVRSSIFSSLVQETSELHRLNFVKQEGLMWLSFPSATHSRYSATLGTWHLADVAIDNIPVVWLDHDGRTERTNLGTYLGEWVEEFRLAVLLHDIGHFPFSLTIETNDDLKNTFCDYNKERYGEIDLRHENFAISMLWKTIPDSRLAEQIECIWHLYRDYKESKKLEERRWISDYLSGMGKRGIDLDKLCYLLNPDPDAEFDKAQLGERKHKDVPPLTQKFLKQAKELIIGSVDLGHLDRYGRVTHFVSGRAGGLPVRPFIQNVVLQASTQSRFDEEKPMDFDPDFQIGIAAEGVDFAFQILYFVTNVLIPNILNDEDRLAYETMINVAINLHWKSLDKVENTKEKDKLAFRRFLPFYGDDEVMTELDRSDDDDVRKLTSRIRQRKPFKCVGKFQLGLDRYAELLSSATSIAHCRHLLREELRRVLPEDCYVRLTKSFGKSIRAKGGGDLACGEDSTSPHRDDWMDMDRLYTIADSGKCTPLTDTLGFSESANLIKKQVDLQRRTFWVFTDAITESGSELKKKRTEIKALFASEKILSRKPKRS